MQPGLSVPSTGGWTAWMDGILVRTLTAGTHTVRLTTPTANGGANIDSLLVAQQRRALIEAALLWKAASLLPMGTRSD